MSQIRESITSKSPQLNQENRLQNSPYFCVFKYARAVKQKALRACEARALRARKTLTPRFTDFFTDFEKKTDCFAVYQENQISTPFFLLTF